MYLCQVAEKWGDWLGRYSWDGEEWLERDLEKKADGALPGPDEEGSLGGQGEVPDSRSLGEASAWCSDRILNHGTACLVSGLKKSVGCGKINFIIFLFSLFLKLKYIFELLALRMQVIQGFVIVMPCCRG